MKRVLLIVVAGFFLALPDPLFAAEGAIAISQPMADGAIPISQSMTIVRPGKYVVTRNITSAPTIFAPGTWSLCWGSLRMFRY